MSTRTFPCRKQPTKSIGSTDVLLNMMRRHLLVKKQRAPKAPLYLVAGRQVSPDIAENAIAIGAIIPRDAGLFISDIGNAQSYVLNLSNYPWR